MTSDDMGVSSARAASRPLIGRAAEVAELGDALDGAWAGQGRLLLVTGEPGIGKTRLAEQVAAQARERGTLVTWGRCWDGGGAPAYWPWVQVVRGCSAAGADHTELAELRRSILTRMEPEAVGGTGDAEFDAEQSRFHLFDVTTQFIKRASQTRPLLIIFDDLHAADAASILLLQFVAREIHDARILLVAAYRDTELRRAGLAAPVAALARDSSRVELRGLSATDVASMIGAACSPAVGEAVAGHVHRITGGNPFFVSEVARRIVADTAAAARLASEPLAIPEEVREAIRQRMLPLAEDTRTALATAAVIGREFAVDVLAAIAPSNARPLLDRLHEASEAGLIQTIGGSFERWLFVHDLIRDTLRADLPPSQRVQLHRRIGELLERHAHGQAAPNFAEIAHHFFQAAPFGAADQALTYAVRAGDQAMQQTAFEEAASQYQRALRAHELRGVNGDEAADLMSRCELLLKLGRAQRRFSRVAVWRGTFQQAAAVARTLMAQQAAAAGSLLAQAALGFAGRSETGAVDQTMLDLIEEGLAALGEQDVRLHARLLARLSMGLYFSPAPERAGGLSVQALALARQAGDPLTLIHCLLARHFILWRPGSVRERLAVAEELATLCEQVGESEALLEARLWRLTDGLESGDARSIDAECAAIEQVASAFRLPTYRWRATLVRAARALCEGRLGDADQLSQQALAIGQQGEAANAMQFYAAMTFHLRRAQGRMAELAPAAQEFADRYPALSIWRAGMALLHVELGQEAQARSELDRLGAARFADLRRDGNWLTTVAVLAEVSAALADDAHAAALYDLLLPYAEQAVITEAMITYLGPVAYYLGRLATVLQRWEQAARHFEVALQMNERLGATLLLAETHYAYAVMLIAPGGPRDRKRARGYVRAARGAALELGLVALEARAGKLDEQLSGRTDDADPRETTSSQAVAQRGGQVFRQEAQFWTVEYGGIVSRFKHSRGLFYLHYLLRHPGQEFLANDLVAAALGRNPETATRGGNREEQQPRPEVRSPGAGGTDVEAVLDAEAKAAYRRRVRELKEELEEAESFNDVGRSERARQEIEAIEQQLSAAIGLGGRDRTPDPSVERARIAVTKAVLLALKVIAASNPALRQHFGNTIKTGRFCSYAPDPASHASWTTE